MKRLILLLLTCSVSQLPLTANAAIVEVEQVYEGMNYLYADFANNFATVTATFDDAGVTGVGGEYVSLSNITFDLTGDDIWLTGFFSFDDPTDYRAFYQDGSFQYVFGNRWVGNVSLRFAGTYAESLGFYRQYHGMQVMRRVSLTGPVPVQSVPAVDSLLLLLIGVCLAGCFRGLRPISIERLASTGS